MCSILMLWDSLNNAHLQLSKFISDNEYRELGITLCGCTLQMHMVETQWDFIHILS